MYVGWDLYLPNPSTPFSFAHFCPLRAISALSVPFLSFPCHSNAYKMSVPPQQHSSTPPRIKKRLDIRTMLRLGHSIEEIMWETKAGRRTVLRWKKRFATDEVEADKPRTGRPKKVTASAKAAILKARGKRKQSTRKISKKKPGGVSLSPTTVRRVLHGAGLKPYKRRRVQRISDAGKRKRVVFAEENLTRDWTKVLMTDEVDIDIELPSNPKNDIVWASSPDEVPPVEKQRWCPKVKAWAGVCAHGKTKLFFYEGTLDGVAYRRLLARALPDIRRLMAGVAHWTFQHDGASAHKDARTNAWLAARVPEFITSGPSGKWPPTSPDLNYIEDMWGILEDKREEYDERPDDIPDLKRKLQASWASIPTATLKNAALSMPRRLAEVIENEGAALRR